MMINHLISNYLYSTVLEQWCPGDKTCHDIPCTGWITICGFKGNLIQELKVYSLSHFQFEADIERSLILDCEL